jgi:hypothetical protein
MRHVACKGRKGVNTAFSWENLNERDGLKDQSAHGSIILKRIINKWDRGSSSDFICIRIWM